MKRNLFISIIFVLSLASSRGGVNFVIGDGVVDEVKHSETSMWITFRGKWVITDWNLEDQGSQRYRGDDGSVELIRPKGQSDAEWKSLCDSASRAKGKKSSVMCSYSGMLLLRGGNPFFLDPMDKIAFEVASDLQGEEKTSGAPGDADGH